VPAEIWHSFMSSALSVDHSRGPPLPAQFGGRRAPEEKRLQSPLPPEWSNATKPLRDIAEHLQQVFGGR
jgi:penicillin-binding protein 1A